jgi:hypothetical protein
MMVLLIVQGKIRIVLKVLVWPTLLVAKTTKLMILLHMVLEFLLIENVCLTKVAPWMRIYRGQFLAKNLRTIATLVMSIKIFWIIQQLLLKKYLATVEANWAEFSLVHMPKMLFEVL